MRLMLHFCSLALIVLGLASCGGKPAGSRDLEVSSNFLVSQNFTGGAVVRVQNSASSAYTDYELKNPPFVVAIADGVWDIFVISVDHEGAAHCGGSSNLNLGPQTASINIPVTEGACHSAPYDSFISKIVATWDQSKWDQVKWGP